MKIFFKLLVVVIVLFLISGCTVLNAWIVKGDGKNLKGGYEMASGEAGKIDAIFGRVLFITTEKANKTFMQNIPCVKVTVDNDNKTKTVMIGKQETVEEKP